MSTDYYALKKPFTEIKPILSSSEIIELRMHIERGYCGSLYFTSKELPDAIMSFADTRSPRYGYTEQKTKSSPKYFVLDAGNDLQVISEYGEILDVTN